MTTEVGKVLQAKNGGERSVLEQPPARVVAHGACRPFGYSEQMPRNNDGSAGVGDGCSAGSIFPNERGSVQDYAATVVPILHRR